jgi:POT family proton-dependent oligopeptide transporter
MQPDVPAAAPPRLLFGHPRGLAVLAGTELWERVSFHGMQALLTLYMVEQLLLPGHIEHIAGFGAFRRIIEAATGPLSTQALASMIFGLYLTCVTFMPIVGGAVGDLVGRSRAVVAGAVLMSAGHVCMAFDQSFLLALLLLILGAGALRANLSPQVGGLYDSQDRRREVAFQIYGAAVNCGAFLAPLVTGALGQAYGWHAGFAFAAVGMMIGLVVYLAGRRELPKPAPRAAQRTRVRLDGAERRRLLILLALMPLIGTFWVSQSQVWNTYNLWVRDHLELSVLGFQVPVPWLQSLDGLAPFITLPPMLWFWRWQAKRGREPDEFGKLATGCFLFAGSTLWLALGQFVTDSHHRTPLLWAVAFHFASNLGWLYVSPTTNALYNRTAPRSVTATAMAIGQLGTAVGSLVSGRLGGLYEQLSPLAFWSLHAAITAAGGVAILVFALAFRRTLFSAAAEPPPLAAAQPAA